MPRKAGANQWHMERCRCAGGRVLVGAGAVG